MSGDQAGPGCGHRSVLSQDALGLGGPRSPCESPPRPAACRRPPPAVCMSQRARGPALPTELSVERDPEARCAGAWWAQGGSESRLRPLLLVVEAGRPAQDGACRGTSSLRPHRRKARRPSALCVLKATHRPTSCPCPWGHGSLGHQAALDQGSSMASRDSLGKVTLSRPGCA